MDIVWTLALAAPMCWLGGSLIDWLLYRYGQVQARTHRARPYVTRKPWRFQKKP